MMLILYALMFAMTSLQASSPTSPKVKEIPLIPLPKLVPSSEITFHKSLDWRAYVKLTRDCPDTERISYVEIIGCNVLMRLTGPSKEFLLTHRTTKKISSISQKIIPVILLERFNFAYNAAVQTAKEAYCYYNHNKKWYISYNNKNPNQYFWKDETPLD